MNKSSPRGIIRYSVNTIHEVTGTHARTIEDHLRHGAAEVNREIKKLGSPLELKATTTEKMGAVIYGCEYGPLGIVRWPILPRQVVWRRTRPTPFLDRLEWRLNRPRIL